LVEGGAKVFGNFFKRKLFQKIVAYIAPKVFGTGTEIFKGFAENNPQKETLVFDEITQIGNDIKVIAYEREFYKKFL